jgi:hypothetical protein
MEILALRLPRTRIQKDSKTKNLAASKTRIGQTKMGALRMGSGGSQFQDLPILGIFTSPTCSRRKSRFALYVFPIERRSDIIALVI